MALSDRGFALIVGGAAVALIVAALATIGGPLQGRQERRDLTRLQDLYALHSFVTCVADTSGGSLPQTLDATQGCDRPVQTADRFTGAAYVYEKRSPTAYVLCAGFEDAAAVAQRHEDGLVPETGCVQFTYLP